ncbi:MAG TPA: hypothetical protein VGC39_01180 [Candidatus Methylacidiphilales bacterium]
MFLVLLVVLAVVWMGPVSAYLERGRMNRGVESAHTISTLLSQYATDNNGVYPVGEGTPLTGKSEGIARNLLENNYTPDASIFAVGSTPRYGGKAADFSDLSAANISWDFTAGSTTTTGLTPAASDLLPTVYSTGQDVVYPTTMGAGLDLPLSGNGPFGNTGVVVAYKDNHAAFLIGRATGTNVISPGFISKELKDTGTYTQIKP